MILYGIFSIHESVPINDNNDIKRNILNVGSSLDQKLNELETSYKQLQRTKFLSEHQKHYIFVSRFDRDNDTTKRSKIGKEIHEGKHNPLYSEQQDEENYQQQISNGINEIIFILDQLYKQRQSSKTVATNDNIGQIIEATLYQMIYDQSIHKETHQHLLTFIEKLKLKKSNFVDQQIKFYLGLKDAADFLHWTQETSELNKYFPWFAKTESRNSSKQEELLTYLHHLESGFNEWTLYNYFTPSLYQKQSFFEAHCRYWNYDILGGDNAGIKGLKSDNLELYDSNYYERRNPEWFPWLNKIKNPSTHFQGWYDCEHKWRKYVEQYRKPKIIKRLRNIFIHSLNMNNIVRKNQASDTFSDYYDKLNITWNMITQRVLENVKLEIEQTLDNVIQSPENPRLISDVEQFKDSLNIHDNLDSVINLDELMESFRILSQINADIMATAWSETGEEAKQRFFDSKIYQGNIGPNGELNEYDTNVLKNKQARSFEFEYPIKLQKVIKAKKNEWMNAYITLRQHLLEIVDKMIMTDRLKLEMLLIKFSKYTNIETDVTENGKQTEEFNAHSFGWKDQKLKENPMEFWKRFCNILSKSNHDEIIMADLLKIVEPFIQEIVFKISDKTKEKYQSLFDPNIGLLKPPMLNQDELKQFEQSCIINRNGTISKGIDMRQCIDKVMNIVPIVWIISFEIVGKMNEAAVWSGNTIPGLEVVQWSIEAFNLLHLQYVTLFLLTDLRLFVNTNDWNDFWPIWKELWRDRLNGAGRALWKKVSDWDRLPVIPPNTKIVSSEYSSDGDGEILIPEKIYGGKPVQTEMNEGKSEKLIPKKIYGGKQAQTKNKQGKSAQTERNGDYKKPKKISF